VTEGGPQPINRMQHQLRFRFIRIDLPVPDKSGVSGRVIKPVVVVRVAHLVHVVGTESQPTPGGSVEPDALIPESVICVRVSHERGTAILLLKLSNALLLEAAFCE